jgi:hypothetical protein
MKAIAQTTGSLGERRKFLAFVSAALGASPECLIGFFETDPARRRAVPIRR